MMVQGNEIVMFVLGLGGMAFVWGNTSRIRRIRYWPILVSGFCVLFAAWTLTILEAFFWPEIFNFLEHICYALSSLLVALWCWKVALRGKMEAK